MWTLFTLSLCVKRGYIGPSMVPGSWDGAGGIFVFLNTFVFFFARSLWFFKKVRRETKKQQGSPLPKDVKVGIHSFLCGETFHTKKTAKNCLIKIFLCKTFCIGEKIQVAKTTTFKRCMHLKPQKTKVHLLKFMVNCFFSHFYQVCISKRFFSFSEYM